MAFSKLLVTTTAFAVSLVYFLALFAIVSSKASSGHGVTPRRITEFESASPDGASAALAAEKKGPGGVGKKVGISPGVSKDGEFSPMMNFKRSDEVESRGMNEGYKSSSGFEAANYGPGGLGVKFAPEAESGGMFGTRDEHSSSAKRQFSNGPGGSEIAAGPGIGMTNSFGGPLPP